MVTIFSIPPAPESSQTLSRCGVWPGLHRLWSNDKNWHLFLLKWQFFLGQNLVPKKRSWNATWVICHMLVVCFFFQAKSVVEMWPHFCPRCGLVASFAVTIFGKLWTIQRQSWAMCHLGRHWTWVTWFPFFVSEMFWVLAHAVCCPWR